jgi:hypothetical protein
MAVVWRLLARGFHVLCTYVWHTVDIPPDSIDATFTTHAFPMKYTKDGSSNDEEILFAAGSSPYAITYGEWTARWWQWAYSIPKDVHPAYEDSGKYCSQGQGGPVWFLAGSYKHPAER